MRLKHLESALSSLQREFPHPDVTLEQYPSSPQLAASVVWTAYERGDVGPSRTVLDLGAGTGLLTAAALVLESDFVWAVDCDEEALRVAMDNVRLLFDNDDDDDDDEEKDAILKAPVSFVLAKVKSVNNNNNNNSNQPAKGSKGKKHHKHAKGGRGPRGRGHNNHNNTSSTQQVRDEILADGSGTDGIPLPDNCVDTVLTNPPFGTKHNNAGMDLRFLRVATRLARRCVYSFHKTSTRAFLQQHVTEVWKLPLTVVAEMKFDLPHTMKFHKHASVDVNVDLIRIDVSCPPPPTTTTTTTTTDEEEG